MTTAIAAAVVIVVMREAPTLQANPDIDVSASFQATLAPFGTWVMRHSSGARGPLRRGWSAQTSSVRDGGALGVDDIRLDVGQRLGWGWAPFHYGRCGG